MDDADTRVAVQPWQPMTRLIDIRHIGKLGEELNELGSAASRCLIQGIDGIEPDTGKPNRQWLAEEIADVLANAELVIEHFELDRYLIAERKIQKKNRLRVWHAAELGRCGACGQEPVVGAVCKRPDCPRLVG